MRLVVKIGGSLRDRGREVIEILIKLSHDSEAKIVVVPGGGVFADLVREHSKEISQDTAHWMAIHAMDQYGLYLADGSSVQLFEDLGKIGDSKGTFILLPYMIMRQLDPLPHSWDVTSDTIAAWVANEIGAEFIKLTDVDGIFLCGSLQEEIKAEELIGKRTCIDRELPKFLMDNAMNCTVLNGKYPERITDAIIKREFIGTVILGN